MIGELELGLCRSCPRTRHLPKFFYRDQWLQDSPCERDIPTDLKRAKSKIAQDWLLTKVKTSGNGQLRPLVSPIP